MIRFYFNFCELQFLYLDNWKIDYIQRLWDFAAFNRGFRGGCIVNNLPANGGDMGLTPGLGISPAGGNGNPLQYPCLENLMDRVACGLQSVGSQRVRHDWATKQQQPCSINANLFYSYPSCMYMCVSIMSIVFTCVIIIYLCVCIYIYIYRERERGREFLGFLKIAGG